MTKIDLTTDPADKASAQTRVALAAADASRLLGRSLTWELDVTSGIVSCTDGTATVQVPWDAATIVDQLVAGLARAPDPAKTYLLPER